MTNETQKAPEGPGMAQAFVMLGAGIMLGAGGCSAFMGSLTSGSGPEGAFGGIGFLLGVFLTIFGAIRLSRAMRGGGQQQ